MEQKELKIDPELRDLLPPLTDDEYKQLEKNIVENGFDKNFPIMEWNGFIVDGHNRYSICKKHNIDYVVGTLGYETRLMLIHLKILIVSIILHMVRNLRVNISRILIILWNIRRKL